MLDIVKQFLTSKKALATLAAILVWVAGRFGWNIGEETLLPIIGMLATFVLAQGWADHGKEAVKEQAKQQAKGGSA